jgi:hypothetical protein
MMLALILLACGSERWDVKTLTDRSAGKLEPAQQASVAQLLSLPTPRWGSHAPRHRIERAVVVVDVEVLAFKTEPDDDIHAMIRGGKGEVMIAEFPASWCTTGSRYAKEMESARRRFLAAMQQHVQHLRLTGVIFFDKEHGQAGASVNGVELHPVLRVDPVPAGAERAKSAPAESDDEGDEEETRGE